MYRSLLSRNLMARNVFAEIDRLQREMQHAFDLSPSIRGLARGGYPALNVGTTPQSVEIFCFAPGVEPNSIELQIEKGVLTIAGERRGNPAAKDDKTNLHIDERFAGKFRRVVTLPDDIDPDAVQATYRDGVLQVSVQRRKAVQPRRISVQ